MGIYQVINSCNRDLVLNVSDLTIPKLMILSCSRGLNDCPNSHEVLDNNKYFVVKLL